MPIDLLIYRKDTLKIGEQRRIDEKDPNYRKISAGWSLALQNAFAHIDEYGDDTTEVGREREMPKTVAEDDGTAAAGDEDEALDQLSAGVLVRGG